MKKYSSTFAFLISAAALPALAQWGFSETCSQEIAGLGVPYLLSLPGLIGAAISRYRKGDITVAGVRK